VKWLKFGFNYLNVDYHGLNKIVTSSLNYKIFWSNIRAWTTLHDPSELLTLDHEQLQLKLKRNYARTQELNLG
jgi:hypothetical protein